LIQVGNFGKSAIGWEFCCDEDDPVLFGLISALGPAAGSSNGLLPDGLIQLNTRKGERLFLTPSSLVSVDVAPINDAVQLIDTNRLVTPSPKPADSLSNPAVFALVPNALPDEIHRSLVRHALAQEDAAQHKVQNGICELSLIPLEPMLTRAFRSHVDQSRTKLNLPATSQTSLHLGLFAIRDGGSITWSTEPDEILSLFYHCHKQPRAFTGGGIRLFDSIIENGVSGAGTTFRDVAIEDNSVLIFPSQVVSAGLPVSCATRAFAEGLFVLRGAVRREQVSE
jgi:hypothetical protein